MRRHGSRLVAPLAALALVAGAALAGATAGVVTEVAARPQPAMALENGLARTPPMGFNNWNTTACRNDFNEAMVRATADLFVSTGLKDAGYQYVNIDDCWALPQRDARGNLVPHPVRFPNGIKAVADYVHSKGLKFGIYTSAGTKTCNRDGGFPGGLDHEQQDANLFASWGVDYLKYDNCNNQGRDAIERYTKMRDALARTGRPIVYSICEWGRSEPKVWTWGPDTGNLWRTTGDINDTWAKTVSIAKANMKLAQYAKPGAWNDPDMLEVGNGGMTDTEYRSHFSLWAIMAAPLLIGTDLRKHAIAKGLAPGTLALAPGTLEILGNRDVIAIDQDRLGKQATVIRQSGGTHVLAKQLANGDRAVALFNENSTTTTISTSASEIGMGGAAQYTLRDLWTKSSRTTTGTIRASVPPHATVLYRVSRSGEQTPPPAGISQLSDLAWTGATNGWGPVERDTSVGERAAGDGRTIRINGRTFAKGLGAHALSEITYHLGGKCSTVVADVGVDDEKATKGTVVFQIFRDDTKVADSGTMTTSSAAKRITGDVTGGTTLRLVVTDAGDGIDSDHADWADAKVTCTA